MAFVEHTVNLRRHAHMFKDHFSHSNAACTGHSPLSRPRFNDELFHEFWHEWEKLSFGSSTNHGYSPF